MNQLAFFPMPADDTLSYIERQFYRRAIQDPRLIDLRCQVKILDYWVDFYAEDVKVAIETDGHDFHSSPEQRDHDTTRDRRLTLEGITVLRFTGRQIKRDLAACVLQAAQFVQAERNRQNARKHGTNHSIPKAA